MADPVSRLIRYLDRSKGARREIAKRLRLDPSMLSHYCSRTRVPGLTAAFAIEDVTGIPARWWIRARRRKTA